MRQKYIGCQSFPNPLASLGREASKLSDMIVVIDSSIADEGLLKVCVRAVILSHNSNGRSKRNKKLVEIVTLN